MILLLLAALALADVPPEPGFVETCTLARHQREGLTCTTCEGYHGGREPCEQLEQQGYMHACRTSGASVWTEVMCKAGETEALVAPTPPEPTPTPAEPAPAPASQAKGDEDSSSRCDTLSPAAAWPVLLLPLLGLRRRGTC